MIIKKDYEIVKAKGERRSLALKAKKESIDEECSTFGSEDEQYAMAPPRDKNQRSFVKDSCSASGEENDEKINDETCLVAQVPNEMKKKQLRFTEKKNLENDIEDETLKIDEIFNIKESRNHPLENVIENLNQRTLRPQAQDQSNFFCFISTIKPKNVNEALADES
nr:Gag-Pol polyprotein [Tanacetum cinerariifolium]